MLNVEFYRLYNGVWARGLMPCLCRAFAVIFAIFTKVCRVFCAIFDVIFYCPYQCSMIGPSISPSISSHFNTPGLMSQKLQHASSTVTIKHEKVLKNETMILQQFIASL